MDNQTKMPDREIQLTADGSHTLYIKDIDEHYHSVNGAIQESLHVFIDAGLKQLNKDHIRLLEIGFGTGLNAFLTFMETAVPVEYYTTELYPLEPEIIQSLNYGELISPEKKDIFRQLHTVPWNKVTQITDRFSLNKIHGDSNTCELPTTIDLIYFDAFAPDKQPEMWNPDIFNRLFQHTEKGGILTTYCAKGSVRRMMKEAGYSVERIPGPPGKREMLRAIKQY